MSKSQLAAEKRNNDLNPRQLRSSGKVPATLYGKGMDSISLELDLKNFANAYKKDKNAIFELRVDNQAFSTIVKRVQVQYTNDSILNVEFQQIRENEVVRMTVPIEILGKSPAVVAGGDLIINYTEMEVECLPADIPHSIKIDISGLEKLEDSITVSEVNYPKGVRSIETADDIVVKVAAPKVVKEEEAAPVEGDVAVQEAAEA